MHQGEQVVIDITNERVAEVLENLGDDQKLNWYKAVLTVTQEPDENNNIVATHADGTPTRLSAEICIPATPPPSVV